MLEILDVVAVYFFTLCGYPFITLGHALEAPVSYFGFWLTGGVVVWLLLRRLSVPFLHKLWFVLWFMPSTIICGSWELEPWPVAFYAAFFNGCSTWLSLTICLVFNLGLVYGVTWLYRLIRRLFKPSKLITP